MRGYTLVRYTLALLVSLLSAALFLTRAQGVGTPAPNFTLLRSDGEVVQLDDLKGRPVLLNVWATWCPPCTEELPFLERIALEVEGALEVVLINNAESLERATAFLEAQDIGLKTLGNAARTERVRFRGAGVRLDTTQEVLRRYRVLGMPTSVFVGADGTIQAVWVGLVTPGKAAELLAEVGVTWQP